MATYYGRERYDQARLETMSLGAIRMQRLHMHTTYSWTQRRYNECASMFQANLAMQSASLLLNNLCD
jgi:hypothetical protein